MEHVTDMTKLSDSPTAYGVISRFNHWVIAAAMIGLLVSGLIMAYGPFEREAVGVIRDWHKPVGVLVLGYGLWRVVWRVVQGFPREASTMPNWKNTLSKFTHWSLLGMVLVMPISGILKSIYAGRDVVAFELVIPAQVKVEWVAYAAGAVHHYADWALIGLLALHIAGALKHHFIDGDTTLHRMIGRSRKDFLPE